MYHRDGGEGVDLVGRDVEGASWPSASADGKYLYFHMSTPGQTVSWAADGVEHETVCDVIQGAYNVRRLELRTGQITAVSSGESSRQYRLSSGGAVAPEVSPDGRRSTR